MRKLVSTKNLSREKWLNVRRSGLGGSDIGAVVGLSKFGSPISVYLQKVSNLVNEETDAMYFGTALEDFVAKEFVKRMTEGLGDRYCQQAGKWKVQKVNYILQHDEHDWMLANLDRVVTLPDGSKAILECKTASAYASKDWDEDKTPESYWCQVQWYMGITGIHRCFVAVLIGGQKFAIREILFHPPSFDTMIEKGRAFWDLVEARTPPALDGSEDGNALLQALYPNPQDETIPLPMLAVQMILQYNEASEEIKAAEKRKDFARQHLCNMLGDAGTAGQVEGWKITWKPVERGTLDTKALRKDHPAIASAYTKFNTSRVFTLSSLMDDTTK